MYKYLFTLLLIAVFANGCMPTESQESPSSNNSFTWDNALVYFLLTDRFANGNETNDYVHTDENEPAPYRGFMGGDIAGITAKLNEGYFTDLGVQAIWLTPVVEQISGSVDEGTGNSFGFHGYWTRDWTALDRSFGTEAELKTMVETAHSKGIRVIMDVVANHTGPVTRLDPVWPANWVKTQPQCTYQDFLSTVDCTLVANLPDVKTELNKEVSLPPFLMDKWEDEGRYDTEVAELEEWFSSTGYPRTPTNYILKWLVDFIKEYGIDGFRVDTVKHTEGYVWKNLSKAARRAWATYQIENPEAVIDQLTPFYMVGEVYN